MYKSYTYIYMYKEREKHGKMLAFSDYIAKRIQKFLVLLLRLSSMYEVFQNKIPEVLPK